MFKIWNLVENIFTPWNMEIWDQHNTLLKKINISLLVLGYLYIVIWFFKKDTYMCIYLSRIIVSWCHDYWLGVSWVYWMTASEVYIDCRNFNVKVPRITQLHTLDRYTYEFVTVYWTYVREDEKESGRGGKRGQCVNQNQTE